MVAVYIANAVMLDAYIAAGLLMVAGAVGIIWLEHNAPGA
jgi:hypothetical protein